MATHASRDTTTGLQFEELTDFQRFDGKRIRKKAFCNFIEKQGGTALIWRFEPDDAYYFEDTNEIVIYEKKRQSTQGTADEKCANCGWRLEGYRMMAKTIGIPPEKVHMIYIFSDWFKAPKYKHMLDYMERQGCEYFFWNDDDKKKMRLMNYRYKEQEE